MTKAEEQNDVSTAKQAKSTPNGPAVETANAEAAVVEGEVVDDEATEVEQDPAELAEALAKAEAKAAENLDGWQRARADFLNYKRRMETQLENTREYVTGNVIGDFLPVIDDLELALQNLPDSPEAEKWSEGISLVYRKIQTMLEKYNVERLPGEGEPFDPTIHEAISQEDSPDHESGHIIAVLRAGYRMGDRVIRPSLVRVAS